MSSGAASTASGRPISVLKFSGLACDARREQRTADVLDRGLAGRARDPDHASSPAPLARRGPGTGARPGVRGAEHPARGSPRRPRSPCMASSRPHWVATRIPQAPSPQRGGAELATVESLARQADEQVALPTSRESMTRAGGTAGPAGREHLRPGRRGETVTSNAINRRRAVRRSLRSSSRATSRSSNGIFRPSSNSWPCSCPLPAITTWSPSPARQRQRDRGPPVRLDHDLGVRALRRSRSDLAR